MVLDSANTNEYFFIRIVAIMPNRYLKEFVGKEGSSPHRKELHLFGFILPFPEKIKMDENK